jgi:hypothetical protein
MSLIRFSLVLVTGVLASCGNREDPAPTPAAMAEQPTPKVATPSSKTPRKPIACQLVSPEEISQRLGRRVTSIMPTDDPQYCMWNTGASPGIIGDVRVALDLKPINFRDDIERMLEPAAAPVDGLGAPAAIELRNRPDFYKVQTIVEGAGVEVTGFGDSKQLQSEQVIALTHLVASRL